MFEIRVDDARVWKNCVDAIVNLIDEGTLEILADKMQLRAMDPSQIAMISFSIPKSSFSKYEVGGSTKIGLNFENLSKILARARDKESLTLRQDENKLVLEFVGDSKRKFSVPIIDIPYNPQKEPKIEHDVLIKINGGKFKDILRDASLISSHLALEANDKGFSVSASGDSGNLDVQSSKDAEGIIGISQKQPARATFPLQYLEDIVKACPEEGELKINLKTKMPVKLEYGIGEASLTYYLAPRIDED